MHKLSKKQKEIYDWLLVNRGYIKKSPHYLSTHTGGDYNTIDYKYALQAARKYVKGQNKPLQAPKVNYVPNYQLIRDITYKALKQSLYDQNNVLAIADMHLPFCKHGYMEFCLKMRDKYNCGTIVLIGDEVDLCAVSQYEKDPDGFSAGTEADLAQKELYKWYEAFPEAFVCIGNHTARPFRMAKSMGIPKKFIKPYEEAWNAPKGWKWAENWVFNGVLYTHGTGFSGANAAIRIASAHRQNTVVGHIHCIPVSYKVLTKDRGWITMNKLDDTDLVTCYDRNGRIAYSNILGYKQGLHKGRFYKFDNQHLKQLVTDEHHFYTNDHKYLNLEEFLEQPRSKIVKCAEPLILDKDYDISDELLRFIVAFCADGSYDYNSILPNIRFHLKKQRKIDRLKKLIEDLGFNIEFSKSLTGSFKSKHISIELREIIYNLLPVKKLPLFFKQLSNRQCDIVINELSKWDGSVIDKGDNTLKQYVSIIEEDCDLIQEILLKNGILSKRYKDNTVTWHYHGNMRTHRFNIGELGGEYFENDKGIEVACLTTEYNNFFIMTDENTVELTGNSEAGIQFNASRIDLIWGMQLGGALDDKSYAAYYAKDQLKKSIIGCGVVLNGKTPIYEAMPL